MVLTYLLGWATKWSHIPKTTHCSPGSSCNWGAHPPRWHRCAPPKSRPLAQENSGGIPRTSLNRKHCHDKAIWCYMKFKVIFGEHFLEDQSCFLVQFLYIYIYGPINVKVFIDMDPQLCPWKNGSSEHGTPIIAIVYGANIFPIFEESPWIGQPPRFWTNPFWTYVQGLVTCFIIPIVEFGSSLPARITWQDDIDSSLSVVNNIISHS